VKKHIRLLDKILFLVVPNALFFRRMKGDVKKHIWLPEKGEQLFSLFFVAGRWRQTWRSTFDSQRRAVSFLNLVVIFALCCRRMKADVKKHIRLPEKSEQLFPLLFVAGGWADVKKHIRLLDKILFLVVPNALFCRPMKADVKKHIRLPEKGEQLFSLFFVAGRWRQTWRSTFDSQRRAVSFLNFVVIFALCCRRMKADVKKHIWLPEKS
jgi:hypothetical protein